MTERSIKKKVVQAIIATGFVAGSIFLAKYLKAKYKARKAQNAIQYIPNKHPPQLTDKSLCLIIDLIKAKTQAPVSTSILTAREARKSLNANDNSYAESIQKKNTQIDRIIKKFLTQVLQEVDVEEDCFRRSMFETRSNEPELKFGQLKRNVMEKSQQLKPDEIKRILNYYLKSMMNVLNMTYTNLMEEEVLNHVNDDKIFWKFGVERWEVMSQAEEISQSDQEVAKLLREYYQLRETIKSAN